MAMMRWDPFGEALKMQRDMDRIFGRLGAKEGTGSMTTAWMPRINVKRSGDDLVMNVELAGIMPEDVDIEVTDGVLTVKGERKGHTEREDEGWIIRESNFGSFERTMLLPEGVDAAAIRADFRDGMLEVHVPKAMEMSKPTTTKISIGEAAPEPKQMQASTEQTEAPAEQMQASAEQPYTPEAPKMPEEQPGMPH